jgi:hypothetical protein
MLEPELDVSGGKAERPILDQASPASPTAATPGSSSPTRPAQPHVDARRAADDPPHRRRRRPGHRRRENFDDSAPRGRMGRNVHLSIGHMQLERYGASFARAKASAVERGIWPLPKAPLGYSVTPRKHGGDGKLRPDPDAATVVAAPSSCAPPGSRGRDRRPARRLPQAGEDRRNRVYLGEINYGERATRRARAARRPRALRGRTARPPAPRAGPPGALLAGSCAAPAASGA